MRIGYPIDLAATPGLPRSQRPEGDVSLPRPSTGFTLVEMLVVMGVIVILVSLITPAFTGVNAARNLTRAAYDIAGQLDNARAYAKANSTYAWVGFFEEMSGQPPGTAGTGRVVVSVIASKDSTSVYNRITPASTALDASPSPAPSPATAATTRLQQIGKLLKLDNVALTTVTTAAATPTYDSDEIPSRERFPNSNGTTGPVPDDYLVGTDNFKNRPGDGMGGTNTSIPNTTTFNFPIGATPGTYKFVKIIEFNPAGDATKIADTPPRLMEIDLRPAHGSVIEKTFKKCVAIQIAGIGGRVRIYQP